MFRRKASGDGRPEGVRLSVFADNREGKIESASRARMNGSLAAAIGRVMGKIASGFTYPLREERVLDGWVRASEGDFLKLDFPPATIICAASLNGQAVYRILRGVVNGYAAAQMNPSSSFSFVPIVLAGVCNDVIYYVEAPSLPEIVSPELVMDSVRFCHFLVFGEATPFQLEDHAAYAATLQTGEDPIKMLTLEPFLRNQMNDLAPEARRQLIAQVGAEIASIQSNYSR
jgi:hypothetical protein